MRQLIKRLVGALTPTKRVVTKPSNAEKYKPIRATQYK